MMENFDKFIIDKHFINKTLSAYLRTVLSYSNNWQVLWYREFQNIFNGEYTCHDL